MKLIEMMKNKNCFTRCITRLVLVISLLCSQLSHADDPDAMVRTDCDKKTDSILIEQFWKEMPISEPYPRKVNPSANIVSLRGLMWSIESPNGVVIWKSRPIRKICKLSGWRYVVVLKGYKYSDQVQGMCGAGSPTLALDLYRNERLLISNLVFDKGCSLDQNVIASILVNAKRNSSVLVVGSGEEPMREVRLTLDRPLTRKRIFGKE